MIDISAVRDELLARANVVGVGIGYKTTGGEVVRDEDGNPIQCVVVSVARKVPVEELSSSDLVPSAVDGDQTDVVETGPISIITTMPAGEASAEPPPDPASASPEVAVIDPKQRVRPIVPGLSIGLNPGVTAGTLGFVVQRPESPSRYILSNWHVIAASNVPIPDRDVVTVTQPGNADGGRAPQDVVASLAEFVPIGSGDVPIPDPSDCGVASIVAWLPNLVARLAGSQTRLLPVVEVTAAVQAEGDNLVDAALALIEVDYERTTPEIGVVTGTATPTLGMPVQKFGRTTGHTTGTITQIGATFVVQGYPEGPATFVDQIAISSDDGSFLAGGDSGSGLTTMDGEAVGLCFAGSSAIGIANTWQNVEAALDVTPAQS